MSKEALLYQKKIFELKDLFAKGEASAEEITKSFLDRIHKTNKTLNSFITVCDELALKQAKKVDEKRKNREKLGVLAGVPLAIKDLITIEGTRTTCASKVLSNFVPYYDATVITKLREADTIFLGKTNMDEFAMGSSNENSFFGPVKNPWDLERVPGGSSGGSAVAVAANQCAGALGSDTGGSVRLPASFCNIVGLKPTYGRVSRFGLVAFASSLDQIGPMTQDIRDCALLSQAIFGYDPKDSTSSDQEVPHFLDLLGKGVKNLKIGIPREYFQKGLEFEVEESVKKSLSILESLGASIQEVNLPHTEHAISAYYLIATSEASSNLARYDGVRYGYRTQKARNLMDLYETSRGEGFGNEVKRRIMLGTFALSTGYYDAYYKKASQVRTLLKEDFEKAFQKVDILVTPTAPDVAFKLGEKVEDPLQMYLSDVYTTSINLAGVPALSMPCGFNKKGLPIGLQLIAPLFQEDRLFQVGSTLEKEIQKNTSPFRIKL